MLKQSRTLQELKELLRDLAASVEDPIDYHSRYAPEPALFRYPGQEMTWAQLSHFTVALYAFAHPDMPCSTTKDSSMRPTADPCEEITHRRDIEVLAEEIHGR